MKLLIASAALACLVCAAGCNSSALKSGPASLTAQGGQAPKDEYKLSTDSRKDKAKSLPVTFSHVNHATKNYSVDGTKPIGCVECHHTDQPAAEAAKHPPLKSAHPADRAVALTAETVKDAKTPKVETCRSCHAQEGAKPALLAAIPEVTYDGDTDPTVLTNEEAFHRNCNSCHDEAVAKRKLTTAPTTNECVKCHTGK
ncbi:MAG TPA: cytochrome c3 family protein [Pyrinomonadaceae bacterium]|jgi:predicted CXXCH cytochrome family protein